MNYSKYSSAEDRELPATKTPPTMERADALATVLACVERIVGKRIDDVSAPFMDSGVDSIASTELADELSRAFSMKLSSTFLFDYPTPAAAARFVVGERALEKTTPIRDVVDDETTRGRGRAVFVGVHVECDAFPRDVDAARRIPYEKWDVDALRRRCDFPGHILPTTFVNAMRDVSHFDADAFGVNAEESRRCDCQQRLALRAALVGRDDVGARVAVHVGVASREYDDAVVAVSSSSALTSTYDAVGSFVSVVSGRVSFVFDFTGPACSVDTACSSSLVAAHHARADLLASLAVVALVGGVNVLAHPRATERFNRAGMLSPSGRCRTLDARADGYARAESCRMFRLSVEGDGNENANAVTVARASAVNQDGRSSSLTAPNGNAQRVVVAACDRDRDDDDVGVVAHLHGTGTPLGDPIEVSAVAATLANARLEASKSWFGHAEPASGVVSLSCLVVHLTSRHSVGVCALGDVNPYLTDVLASTTADATANRARTSCARVDGGASSFAFQGTNARVAIRRLRDVAVARRAHRVEHAQRYWYAPVATPCVTRVGFVDSTVVRFLGALDAVVAVEDHRVDGRAVFPAAGMMHLASRVGACVNEDHGVIASTTVVVASAMLLSEGTTYAVVARLATGACAVASDGGERCTSRYTRPVRRVANDDDDDGDARDDDDSTVDRLRAAHDVPLDARAVYAALLRRGLEYGPRFRALRDVRVDGARSRIAGVNGGSRDDDVAFIAALDGAFHLGAPLDPEVSLAIPVGADACRFGPSTTSFDGARARAMIHTDASFSSHALVPNDARERACVLRLRVKSVGTPGRRRLGAERAADAYASTRCATLDVPPLAHRGVVVDDFARHAAVCLGVVASTRDASARVFGVDAEHANGLFKSAASESYAVSSTFSRAHESCACVEVLMRAHPGSRRRPRATVRGRETPRASETRVFGAFGALGGVAAASAIRARARALALTGRTGRGTTVAFTRVEADATVIRAVAADAASRLAETSTRRARDVFASGTLLDGVLANHTARACRVVCAPKSSAAIRAFRDDIAPTSSRFFSSVAALLGSSGQANYAAANGAVDFIARARRCAGSDDVAVQYGPWCDVGMATRREATMRRLAGMGIGGVRPARGARARACFARAVVCVAAFDLKALALSARHLHRAFMSELVGGGIDRSRLDASVRDAPPPKPPPRPVAKTTTTTASSFDDVKTTTSTIVARALGTTIDDDAPLMQHGLDSLSAIDLAAAVGTRFAVDAAVDVVLRSSHRPRRRAFRRARARRRRTHDEPERVVVGVVVGDDSSARGRRRRNASRDASNRRLRRRESSRRRRRDADAARARTRRVRRRRERVRRVHPDVRTTREVRRLRVRTGEFERTRDVGSATTIDARRGGGVRALSSARR